MTDEYDRLKGIYEELKQKEKDKIIEGFCKTSRRLLPEGFSCVELADGKTLAVFYPEGKMVISEKIKHFEQNELK